MLWYEAVDQLQSRRVLCALSRARWARSGGKVRVRAAGDGWRVEDDSADADNRLTDFDRLELALLDFERRVGQIGLISAVAANRYTFLFPNGSSLGWPRQIRSGWRPRTLPIRLPRLRKAG
jgi:hypothetical protein